MTMTAEKAKLDYIPLPDGCRRLALCFDGTWNSLESQTNVSRLYRVLASVDTQCPDQLTFYDQGVGTEWGTRIRGGALGLGLGRNVLEGYCWLVNTYLPGAPRPDASGPYDSYEPTSAEREETFSRGDLVFLFGFSRGAFTARSLAGMINRVGIVDRNKVWERRPELRGRPLDRSTPEIAEAWELYRRKADPAHGPARNQADWAGFRARSALTVKIAFVGVWDTVGALGLPWLGSATLPFGRGRFEFHDTKLGRVVENAYHAVAIDEHRADYEATLWTAPDRGLWTRVEQRWFPGAHANVGGGYDDDLLCEAPLFWMANAAAELGLVFRRDRQVPPFADSPPPEFKLDGNEYLSPVRDSYGEFLGGIYAKAKAFAGGRHYRRMLVESDGIAQVVDPSARLKWDVDRNYRPRNLAVAGRADVGRQPIPSARDFRIAQGRTS